MGQLAMKSFVIDDISKAAIFDPITDEPLGVFDLLQQLNFQIPVNMTRVYGGTSRFPFHLTQGDSEGSVSATNAVLDLDLLKVATGAEVTTGAIVTPAMEKLTVGSDGTVTVKNATALVDGSDRVVVATKGLPNTGKVLSRVTTTPTADQYSVTSGKFTFGDEGLKGKDVWIFYNYTAQNATQASIVSDSKSKAVKFVAYGKFFDDELNKDIDVVVVLYKTQMLGTFAIDQQRKTATANSIEFAILDPNRADKKTIDIIVV